MTSFLLWYSVVWLPLSHIIEINHTFWETYPDNKCWKWRILNKYDIYRSNQLKSPESPPSPKSTCYDTVYLIKKERLRKQHNLEGFVCVINVHLLQLPRKNIWVDERFSHKPSSIPNCQFMKFRTNRHAGPLKLLNQPSFLAVNCVSVLCME